MKRIIRIIILAAVFGSLSLTASAQRFSVGTNVIGWADFVTVNGEFSAAFSRHFTANLRLRYNPWTFNEGKENQIQNRKRSVAAGVRYWPWHIYSGWWFQADGQLQEYNRGGFFGNPATEEGLAYGGVLSFGYTLMIHENWNIEFGAGAFLGGKNYTRYSCPKCGQIEDRGDKFFFLPDDLKVSFVYIF